MDEPMPNTALSHRQHGDKAWSESTMLQAEMHALYKRAKVLEHTAIIAWAKAEILEMATAPTSVEITDTMIKAGADVIEAKLGQSTSIDLAYDVFAAMTSARP